MEMTSNERVRDAGSVAWALYIEWALLVCAQSLRQYKDSAKESEVLMKALADMQEKNLELENSLSAETRFKQDLFSALGEERRVIKQLQSKHNNTQSTYPRT
jgi:cell shape-determining protein MreC